MKKIFIAISLLFSLTLTSANAVEVLQEAKITGLYVAFFNRAADQEGLTYWTTTADNVAKQGGDVSSVFKTLSKGFATHPTFTSTYAHLNNEAFVSAIYKNSLGRDGDAEGIAYWTDLLDRGMIRSDMVATFVELSMATDLTPANYPSLSAAELAAAQLRQDLITNKVTVALVFTHQLGTLSNVVDSDNPESDPAYIASIMIISGVTEAEATVLNASGFLEGIVGSDDPVGQINASNSRGGNSSTVYILEKDANNKIFIEKTVDGDLIVTEIENSKYKTRKFLLDGDDNVFEMEYQADGVKLTYNGETEVIKIDDGTTQEQEIESQYIGIWREDVDEDWEGDIDIAYTYTDKAIVFIGNVGTGACSQTRTLSVSEFQSLLKNDIDVNDYVKATTYKDYIETSCGNYTSLNTTLMVTRLAKEIDTEKYNSQLDDSIDVFGKAPLTILVGANLVPSALISIWNWGKTKIKNASDKIDRIKHNIDSGVDKVKEFVGIKVPAPVYEKVKFKVDNNDLSGLKENVDNFGNDERLNEGNAFDNETTFTYHKPKSEVDNSEFQVTKVQSYDPENKKVEEVPNYDENGEIVSITTKANFDADGGFDEETISTENNSDEGPVSTAAYSEGTCEEIPAVTGNNIILRATSCQPHIITLAIDDADYTIESFEIYMATTVDGNYIHISTAQWPTPKYGNNFDIDLSEVKYSFKASVSYFFKIFQKSIYGTYRETNVVEGRVPDVNWVDAEESMTWLDATDYCKNLSYMGKDDWRLPSINELQAVMDSGMWDYDSIGLSGIYWSSTTQADLNPDTGRENFAYYAYFGLDDIGYVYNDNSKYYVRCVRIE